MNKWIQQTDRFDSLVKTLMGDAEKMMHSMFPSQEKLTDFYTYADFRKRISYSSPEMLWSTGDFRMTYNDGTVELGVSLLKYHEGYSFDETEIGIRWNAALMRFIEMAYNYYTQWIHPEPLNAHKSWIFKGMSDKVRTVLQIK